MREVLDAPNTVSAEEPTSPSSPTLPMRRVSLSVDDGPGSAQAGPPSPSFNQVRGRRDSGTGWGVVGELGAANSPRAVAAPAAAAGSISAAAEAPPHPPPHPPPPPATWEPLLAAWAHDPNAQMPCMPRRKATMLDISGNGMLMLDSTGDGLANLPVSFVAVDTTGEGRTDALIADSNGDGRGDCLVLDTSGDGIPDTAVVGMLVDLDNDGQAGVLLV